MRSPLSYVPNLEGGGVGELVLDSDVPLISNGRLNLRIPDSQESSLVAGVLRRVAGGCRSAPYNSIGGVGGRKERPRCRGRIDFRRSKWRIQCQTEVCARPFQVGGDGERASDHSVVAEYRGSPGKTNARLEIFASPGSVVEAAAGSALTG